eukprot:gene9307-10289_t
MELVKLLRTRWQFMLAFLVASQQQHMLTTATATTLTSYYENYEIVDSSVITSFDVPSIQNCVQKCQFDSRCNVANIKVVEAATLQSGKIKCLFARLECFENLRDIMQKTTTQPQTQPQTACNGGQFYLKHKMGGKKIYYNDQGYYVLKSTQATKFCTTTSQNRLYDVDNKKCLKIASNSRVTLNNECSTSSANFQITNQEIVSYGSGSSCVWQQQSDNPPENGNEEHSSTKRAAFSVAQSDDATTSRVVVASLQSPSDLACSQKCLRNEKCKFKIYHVETKKCELLSSISEKDFMDEKAIPFKKEEIPHKDDLCKSSTSSGCSENCECVQIWRFGESIYTCSCTKQGIIS